MRIARFSYNEVPQYAFVQKDETDGKDYLVALEGHPLSPQGVKPTGKRYALDADGVRLLVPVIPSKVYGLAKNYDTRSDDERATSPAASSHTAADMVIFTKPSTSVIGPDDPIVIPACSNDMNFEPEVAVVMGKIAKNVTADTAMNYVFGFTCVNDVTLRDCAGSDPMWTRAKGFDTSCPLGPWITTELNWRDAHISFTLNGENVQEADGTTARLIHSIPEQIAAISSFSTLLPGDVILTGTPYPAGTLRAGDEAIVHVDGIGSLRNVIVHA
ncbi:fumarylacetoacetate hydrolase family protein [Gardnerella greenwoodii]|uniref:fumarylacetoacetate hydrolase family protein n=1 Tax=Gardnerella greenwoodii TaxID=2914925 RepID=UPI0002FE1E12|nr:fumarylacetoacetate hydrolase family protein [Gardnerella greenwoodii]